ncbi:Ig-like domain-containing protein [Companilactobacillus sp. HBUAS59699]|uniref:Ig-like domain-containing protein n=1 Tax=Companilactobacillus sp. HBUAS59699 TaxID=3109358 RepID=UPI002FEF4FB7
MREKFNRYLLSILTITITFLCLIKITNATTQNQFHTQYNVEAATAMTPSAPPIKIIGIWLTSGYDVQPDEDNYTTVNKPITLYADAGRSIFAALFSLTASAHYQWYSSDDGLVYSKVSSRDGGTSQNLTVNPSAVGTKYYQLWTDWYTLISWGPIIDTMAYTNIVKVHTLPDPINAESLKVTSDSDYLYNNLNTSILGILNYNVADTTQMHATVKPDEATGTVKWYSSDPSIASVDENTGAVTGNTNKKDGTVTITGIYTNPDGTTITDTHQIEVGGGLKDQTVGVGQQATFTLQGNLAAADGVDISVEWHKVSPDGKTDTIVQTGSKTSYTTPTTTLADDGSHYYANIVVSQTTDGSTKTENGTTNKAKLNVLTKGDPDISQTIEMATTNSNQINGSYLDNIMSGDSITFKDTLTNNSSTGTLSNGKVVIPLVKGAMVYSIFVDNNIPSYTMNTDNPNYDELIISNTGNGNKLDFDLNQTHTVLFSYLVPEITKNQILTTAPTVSGNNSDGSAYSSEGPTNTIHFTTGGITLTPSNISFGSLIQQPESKLLNRTDATNTPNNVLTVDDNRRDLEASQIELSATPLYKETTDDSGNSVTDTNDVLNGDLRYYNADGTYTSLADGETATVETSIEGSPLSSVAWAPQEGLRLYLNNGAQSGIYQGTVTWTAVTSV